jgi:hypothetical protein
MINTVNERGLCSDQSRDLKYSHKPSDFIKGKKFRDKISDKKLFKDSPVPCRFSHNRTDTKVSYSSSYTFGRIAHHSEPILFLAHKIAVYRR